MAIVSEAALHSKVTVTRGPHQRGSKPGFGGFWWVLAGFGGLWRALAGFVGFYRVLDRVLSGFIGFYRVLVGFIGFYAAIFFCEFHTGGWGGRV